MAELIKYFKANVGAFIFLLGYLFIVTFLHYTNVWVNYFDKADIIYLPYNIAKCIWLFYLACLTFATGKIVIKKQVDEIIKVKLDFIDEFIIYSFIGLSVIILLTYVMGIFHLYFFYIALFYTSILIFYSYSQVKTFGKNAYHQACHFFEKCDRQQKAFFVLNFCILLLIFFQIIGILFARVLLPTTVDNDGVGSILPFFHQAVSFYHGPWPTSFFISLYFFKGAGLHFLSAILLDAHSFQLAGFYFFLLSCLIIVQTLRKVIHLTTFPLLGLLLYLQSPISLSSFYKLHIAIPALVGFLFYISALIITLPIREFQKLKLWIILIIGVMPVFLPILTFPVLSVLGSIFLICLLKPFRPKSGFVFILMVVLLASLTTVYTINYLQTGLIDFSLKFFDKFLNVNTFESWCSPLALHLQRIFNAEDSIIQNNGLLEGLINFDLISFLAGKINGSLKIIIIMGLLIYLISWITGGKRKGNIEVKDIYLWQCLIILGTIIVMMLFIRHGALERFTVYRDFFIVWLFIWALSTLTVRFKNKKYYFFIIVALVGLILNQNYLELKNQFSSNYDLYKLKFLLGKSDFLQMYDADWSVKNYWNIQKNIIPGEKVIALNFCPGAYGLPNSIFRRPLQNDYFGILPTILYGNPEVAREALLSAKIRYAVLRADGKESLSVTVLAPIFSPENLKAFWKIAWQDKNEQFYVLSLKSDGADLPIDNHFVAWYSNFISSTKIPMKEAYLEVKGQQDTAHAIPSEVR